MQVSTNTQALHGFDSLLPDCLPACYGARFVRSPSHELLPYQAAILTSIDHIATYVSQYQTHMTTNPIVDVFGLLHPLSEETISDFEQIIAFNEFPRNTSLLEIGKKATTMFFVHKGLARKYYYLDGKDVTDYFAIDGQFIGAVPSIVTSAVNDKAIHLIENSEVYYFKYSEFEACMARHHDLERAVRKHISLELLSAQKRIESLRFYSMKERYELLSEKYPGIMNRCPLHYIASYLGTSQVSISRIRAGLQ